MNLPPADDIFNSLKHKIKSVLFPKTVSQIEKLTSEVELLKTALVDLTSQNNELGNENQKLKLIMHAEALEAQNRMLHCHHNISDPDERDIKKCPSIFLITIPKSASEYITKVLSKNLGLCFIPTLTCNSFPGANIHFEILEPFIAGDVIAKSHCQATDYNLHLLNMTGMKSVILLRDPRAVLLSWTHYLISFAKSKPYALNQTPVYPEPIARGDSFADCLQWSFDNYFHIFVDWMDGWIQCLDQGRCPEAKLLFYEDMVNDEKLFFQNLLEFYDIKSCASEFTPIPKSDIPNFRKGSVSEWRDIFPAPMKKRALDLMRPDWFQRFPWSP